MHRDVPLSSQHRTAQSCGTATQTCFHPRLRGESRAALTKICLRSRNKVLDPVRVVLFNTGLTLPGVRQPHVGRFLCGVVLDVRRQLACFGFEPVWSVCFPGYWESVKMEKGEEEVDRHESCDHGETVYRPKESVWDGVEDTARWRVCFLTTSRQAGG